LRLKECLELRVKDIDLERPQIVSRRGKGQKDRLTVLSTAVIEPLSERFTRVLMLARSLTRVGAQPIRPEVLPCNRQMELTRKFAYVR
jgi:site-specific recombinase XerD